MVITAKFPSVCPVCSQKVQPGEQVEWARGTKASHVRCPDPLPLAGPKTELSRQVAAEQGATVTELDITAPRQYRDNIYGLVSETPAEIAERLCDAYAAQQRLTALAALKKGIYRVSLTGQEKQYGVDHVNVNLVPNEKYGSVKVGEWQGVSVGYVDSAGVMVYWKAKEDYWSGETTPGTDLTNPRVKAVLAALEIILGSADPIAFAKAYAVESSTCWRCGADLVDEKSRERLMGPDCFRSTYGSTRKAKAAVVQEQGPSLERALEIIKDLKPQVVWVEEEDEDARISAGERYAEWAADMLADGADDPDSLNYRG